MKALPSLKNKAKFKMLKTCKQVLLTKDKWYLCAMLLLSLTSALPAQHTHKGQLRLIYLPIERVQIGGDISVRLPTHFSYLNLFDSDTRFAPDEPSSFSSLEYYFWVKKISDKIFLESALGIFRNHTKGDFLPDVGEPIHFGRGNSQVGPCISLAAHYKWKRWSLGTLIQTGMGPQFSRWTSEDRSYKPKDWGIRGFGYTYNVMVFIESPKWKQRYSLRALIAYNISHSSYNDFRSTSTTGTLTDHLDYSLSTRSERPVISISLGYDLCKNR